VDWFQPLIRLFLKKGDKESQKFDMAIGRLINFPLHRFEKEHDNDDEVCVCVCVVCVCVCGVCVCVCVCGVCVCVCVRVVCVGVWCGVVWCGVRVRTLRIIRTMQKAKWLQGRVAAAFLSPPPPI
jgi:hypothetical protein